MTLVHQKPRVYIDIETTGLNPYEHEMIEFGAIKDDTTRFETKIKPEHIETAEPKALEVNGYREMDWMRAPKMSQILPFICNFLDGCVIVGHNVRFDVSFLEVAIKKHGIQKTLGYHLVDTVTLAYEHLVPARITSLSLANVCSALGIPPEPSIHRAMNGAIRAQKVYQELVRAGWVKRWWWSRRLRAACPRPF